MLEKAQRYCDIVDLGQGSYRVTEIYENPKPASLPKLKTGLYQYMAPLILLNLLHEHDENNKIALPLLDLVLYVEMINKNYSTMKYNQKETSEYLNINLPIVSEFFEKLDDTMRYYIEVCLEYLRKSDVLIWYKVPMLRKKNIKRVNLHTSDISYQCSYTDEKATDEEVKFIIDCSEIARVKLGFTNKSDCFYGARALMYRKELSELLRERDILYSYDSYEVFYTSIDRCNKLLSEFAYDNKNALVNKFNTEFVRMNVDLAQARQNKAIGNDATNKLVKKYRLDSSYVNSFGALSSLTIDSTPTQNMYEKLNVTKKDKTSADFKVNILNAKGELI